MLSVRAGRSGSTGRGARLLITAVARARRRGRDCFILTLLRGWLLLVCCFLYDSCSTLGIAAIEGRSAVVMAAVKFLLDGEAYTVVFDFPLELGS